MFEVKISIAPYEKRILKWGRAKLRLHIMRHDYD
jgi:hypothetical protein